MVDLQIGEHVHYGSHGVCQVCGRESKDLGSMRKEYFALKPTGSENILLYLPVDAEPVKVRLRRLLSRGEIQTLLQEAAEMPWIHDNRLRRETWSRVLSGGDAAELIGMVRCLRAHEATLPEGKQLPMNDMEMMRLAKKQLCSEFSYVLHIQEEQALPFVLGEQTI